MSSKGAPVVSFLAGALVGAAVALLYAPSSGEELRLQIKSEADQRLEKINQDLKAALEDLQATAEKTRAEFMSYLEEIQETQKTMPAEVAEEVSEAVESMEDLE